MKLKYLLFIAIISISFFFIDNVSALSYVEDVGKNRYYIAHKWVGNSSSNGNDCYYLGWYSKSSDITIKDYTISSGSDITYYKVCDYSKFIEFLDTGNTSLVDATTTNKKEMSLNSDSSNMMFTNFDIYMDGELYFKSIEYKGTNYNHLIQFVGGYNWNFKQYYGAYIDEDENELYLHGGTQWNSYSTFDLNEYPYWIGWETEYAQICYSKEPFYYDTTDNKYKTGGTFKCGQSNLSFSNKTSYNYSNTDEFVTNIDIYTQDGVLYKESTIKENNLLKLKKSFNSGTNAYGMSKIVWNIDAGTDIQASDGIINFKIQYGANDFTNKNIPIFNSYKIYGMNSYESGWTDITNDERFYFDEFNYEYFTLEGIATETVLTSTLNIPSDMCVYEQIKVEFYFDNTNNFYMYVFDDLYTSEWQDLESYFKDYIYYEFPTNKKYAFISHSNNMSNSGKLYVPYNDIINPDSLFGAYIYNYNKRSITKKLLEQEFYDYDYYYFYDFTFSFDNKEVLMLQRKTGTSEKVSFYVPSDYIVEFSNNENITLLTPDGYVDIDTGKIDNIYRDENVGEVSSFWSTFKNSINYFIEPISEIFEKITIFFNSLPSEIQYTFYVAFIFIILYYLTKFIL